MGNQGWPNTLPVATPASGVEHQACDMSKGMLNVDCFPIRSVLDSMSESEEVRVDFYTEATGEVNRYIGLKRISPEENPLDFWNLHRNTLPTLSRLARKFLAPLLSSAASEREFKVSKAIQGPKRNRLLPNNVETLLFLKHNLRAVGYKSDLPDAPAGLKCPNSSQYDMRLEEHEDEEKKIWSRY